MMGHGQLFTHTVQPHLTPFLSFFPRFTAPLIFFSPYPAPLPPWPATTEKPDVQPLLATIERQIYTHITTPTS